MLPRLRQTLALPDDRILSRHTHVLMVLQEVSDLDRLPAPLLRSALDGTLKRRRLTAADLKKSPVTCSLPNGALVSLTVVEAGQSAFSRLARLREAAAALIDEQPTDIALCMLADLAPNLTAEALYVLMANSQPLPVRKKKSEQHALKTLHLYGARDAAGFSDVAVLAQANTLARELTALPPNELYPLAYRTRLRAMAKAQGWKIEEFDLKKLRALGAGAFVAVAQGSQDEAAAIVRLSYTPRGAKKTLALVGKGICFDTGGHNLKPAKYMAGMHEDMNGSAVALGVFQALVHMGVKVRIEAWLAIAQNHISPAAYKQNEIVTALDGTTIEVVHTDAEGRMVLADTLCLAARSKPDLVIDFATLTGSMISALGNRYAGVFASTPALEGLAVESGKTSGERVATFPLDDDYDKALESRIADVKQCTLEGEADHILAARFLRRFVGERDWLHVDLSAANCPGGLGAIGTDVTGFGVRWGVTLVQGWAG